MIMRALPPLAIGCLLLALGACAATSDQNRQRKDACLKRCYAVDPEGAEPSMFGNPQYPQRRCEQQCGYTGSGASKPNKAPAPKGPPTITGQ